MLDSEILFDLNSTQASCYYSKVSPLPGFDNSCKQCSLGKGKSIGPTGPDDLSKVKLIVVSEHPGHYETDLGFNQVPNSFVNAKKKNRSDRLPPTMNGGELIRRAVQELFNLSHENQVWWTNALKCDPAQHTSSVSKTKHIYKCAGWWLVGEFYLLDKFAPGVPVILCGTKSLNAIEFLYPEIKSQVEKVDLKHTRRRKDLTLGLTNRPVAVTFNPASPAKGHSRIETRVVVNRQSGALEVSSVKDWQPIVLGSPLWHFIKDIQWLKHFI
jgi:hypothetical protein